MIRIFMTGVFLVVLLFGGVLEAGATVTDLGDICLFASASPGSPSAPIVQFMRIGILSYGEGHFELNGTTDVFFGSTAPIHGSMAIDGNNAVMTLERSYSSESPTSGGFTIYHIIINIATLTGRYTAMGFDFSPPGSAGVTAAAIPYVVSDPVTVGSCQ